MSYLVYEGLFDKLRFSYFKKVLTKYRITPKMKLLDYGCGPGDLLVLCQREGIDAYGVDDFPRSVELAKQRGLNVVLGSYSDMPFEKNSFDMIFLQSVLEHISNPLEAVVKITQYLNAGGILVLSCPTPGSHFWDDPTHIRPFTPKSLEIIGELCDCNILEINYVFSFLLGLKIKNSIIYKLLNILPFPLGSNIIGVYQKKHE